MQPSKEFSIKKFPVGTILIRENELSRKMFIIRSGKVRVYKAYVGRNLTLAVLGKGETFGEFSFFDAKPRSATVEAITELEAIVVDGDQATKQLNELPGWVMPLMRMIFERFREADTRLASLLAKNDFEIRHFGNDSLAESIYSELLRFSQALLLVYGKYLKNEQPPERPRIMSEMTEILGSCQISLLTYFKVLSENEFIQTNWTAANGDIKINQSELERWISSLQAEIEHKTYTLLNSSSLALTRQLLLAAEEIDVKDDHNVTVDLKNLDVEHMPLFNEAKDDLTKRRLVEFANDKFAFSTQRLAAVFEAQEILKNFR